MPRSLAFSGKRGKDNPIPPRIIECFIIHELVHRFSSLSEVQIMKQKAKKQGTQTGAQDRRLYTLEVFILSGPMTEQFVKQNPTISRTIQIRGDQTLEDLHHALFDAFGREDEHMYEFQFGKGPHDPKGKRYVLPMALDNLLPGEPKPAGDVTHTPIGSLSLKVDQAFGYWFDFGDDWWHQLNVVAIEDEVGRGKYPRVTKRVGASPPQYIDWDEEDKGN